MTQYHVTLNSQGYVLDLERYQKRPRAAFVSRSSVGAVSFEDLRGPEQILRLTDWSGGEGQVQDGAVSANAYRSGSGIDVYSGPGAVQLGPYAPLVQATTDGAITAMQVFAGELFVGTDVGHVYMWDGSTWSLSATVGGSFSVQAMEVYLNRLYLSNVGNGNLSRFDGTSWSVPATAAGAVYTLRTHYRQAAQYLYLGVVGAGANGIGRLYYFDGVSLSTGQYDTEEAFPLVSFVLGGRCYVAAADASLVAGWSIYSVDDQTAGGVWRAAVRQVPQGAAISACVIGDVAYLGDTVAGRIWTFDGGSVSVLRELSVPGAAYTGRLFALAAWRGALWVGVKDVRRRAAAL